MLRARAAPLALGTLAVLAGAGFLTDAGALPGMASRNVIAFVIGLLCGWGAHRIAHVRHGAALLFGLGCALLALVPVVGIELDGVRRWLPLGPFNIQPALFLSPLLLATAASREGRHWRAAILLPIFLIALQPDAATLMALAVGVAVLMAGASGQARHGWSPRRIGIAAGALCLAVLGLVFAGIQTPPPVAFAEGTIGIALLSGLTAKLLHFAAIALMIAALLCRPGPTGLALAGYFTIAAVAAAFWAFPMPIAGATPSHLLGFGLAIGWLSERYRVREWAPE